MASFPSNNSTRNTYALWSCSGAGAATESSPFHWFPALCPLRSAILFLLLKQTWRECVPQTAFHRGAARKCITINPIKPQKFVLGDPPWCKILQKVHFETEESHKTFYRKMFGALLWNLFLRRLLHLAGIPRFPKNSRFLLVYVEENLLKKCCSVYHDGVCKIIVYDLWPRNLLPKETQSCSKMQKNVW